MRFTITRAVNGFTGEAIQFASALRRPVEALAAGRRISAGLGSRADRNPGGTSSRGSVKSPWWKILVAGGYRLEKVTPVDQFAWSMHVEVVGVFRR